MENFNVCFLAALFLVLLGLNLIIPSNGHYNICVDCSDHFDPKCYVNFAKIEVPENEQHKVRLITPKDKPNANLTNCLLENYIITEDLESMVCSMSPYLGCNLIGNALVMKNAKARLLSCVVCGRNCGCKIKATKQPEPSGGPIQAEVQDSLMTFCLTAISIIKTFWLVR